MTTSQQSKLLVVKSLPSKSITFDEILKTDIEASNRGILALSCSGLLTVVAWIKKKILLKHIEDVSDALWQQKGESELVVTCHSGAMVRYTLHEDSGLTKSLQLSSKSLLALINSKDSSITSVKSLRIWGHTRIFILLQPQPDRVVLLSTNSSGRPNIIGIIKTLSLRSAHLSEDKIIVQPFTGSDIYIYDTATCKTIEVISLVVTRPGVAYIQWDYLSCSSSGSQIAITDSERRLYVAKLSEKTSQGKKSGVIKSRIIPRQVVWPATFQPSTLNDILVFLSDSLLCVFCSQESNHKETFYYLTYNISEGGSLVLQHTFYGYASILPGLPHELPDLFLTEDGVCMLTDKECSVVVSSPLESDFDHTLSTLNEALEKQNMDSILQFKTDVEEDLSLFLSSCNHKEGWMELAEIRSKQHAELVNVILSYLTKAASTNQNRTNLLGLKELAQHHFKTLRDEMSNVLKYVDAEKMSQMLLQMIEQMNFYSRSVETLRLPEGREEDRIILEKFEVWADRPVKEIMQDALTTKCVKVAENYLSLKPWIYGQIDSHLVASCCIDIARQNIFTNLLLNMDRSYVDVLKERLYRSKELTEIRLLEDVLSAWKCLDAKDKLAITLVKYIHRFSLIMITKPPKFWIDLVNIRNKSRSDINGDLVIGTAVQWSSESLCLVLIDVFARSNDLQLLEHLDMNMLWMYLLAREDELYLLKWISHQLDCTETNDESRQEGTEVAEVSETSPVRLGSTPESDHLKLKKVKSSKGKQQLLKHETRTKSFLGTQIYGSDTDSVYSLDSSVWEGIDETLPVTSESSGESLTHYVVYHWPHSYFGFISQSMIDDVALTADAPREKILDTLAQYGLFLSSEKDCPQSMLRRLFDKGWTFDFKPIGNEYEHKIQKKTFDALVLETLAKEDLSTPFFDYVEQNDIDLKSLCLDQRYMKPWVNLVAPFQELRKDQAKETIYNLCLETLSYMTIANEHMIDDFFSVFLTMLYAPHASLSDFINYCKPETSHQYLSDSDPKTKDIKALCNILLKQHLTPLSVIEKLAYGDYPFLQDLLREPEHMEKLDISMYDLLRGNVPFDISGLFTWQKANKYGYNEHATQPSFSDEKLCRENGVECSLDYYYYLKAGRPTYALASILLSVKDENKTEKLKETELPVYGLALRSWPDKRVCSACVALLYLAELDYEPLRTLLYSAELIVGSLEQDVGSDIQENLKKAKMKFLTQQVKDTLSLLCSRHTRNAAAENLIYLLELTLIARVTGKMIDPNDISFYDSKKQEVVVTITEDIQSKEQIHFILLGVQLTTEIASMYKLPPPEGIIEFLAVNDQWLLFLTACQMFQFPQNKVKDFAQKFKSEALREHMELAFAKQMDVPVSDGQQNCEKVKEEEAQDVKCSGSTHEKKQKKKKRRRSVRIRTESQNSATESRDEDPVGLSAEKVNDKEGQSFNYSNDITSFFTVILKCHKMKNPCLSLLEVCVESRFRHFAVVAACYDSSQRYRCLAAWLLVQIPNKNFPKVELHKESIVFLEDGKRFEYPRTVSDIIDIERENSLLEKMLSAFLELEWIDVLQDGFKIFDKSSPVLPILEGLQAAKTGKGFKMVVDALSKSPALYESSNTNGINAALLSHLCIYIVFHGLEYYLNNRSLQKIFLSSLLPFGKDAPFSSKNTDWDLLSHIISALGYVRIRLKIFKMVSCSDQPSVQTVGIKLIQYLTDIEEYKIALHIAELLKLDSTDIFCCQIKSEFDQINNEALNESTVASFLLANHSKVKEKDISSVKASKLFESLAVDSLYPLYAYLCLQYAVIWAYTYKGEVEATADSVNEVSDQVINSSVEWVKYTEYVEFKMWLAYVELLVVRRVQQEENHLLPPNCLGNWPWEFTGSVEVFDYWRVKESAVVEYSLLRCKDCWTLQNYADKLIGKINRYSKELIVTKDDIEQAISALINCCWRKDLIITACRIGSHFNYTVQDINSFLNVLSKACECDFSARSSCGESDSDPRSSKFIEKLSKSSRGLGSSSMKFDYVSLDSEKQRWLLAVSNLFSEIVHCNQTSVRVMKVCRFADALSIPYQKIIHHQNISELLTDILSTDSSETIQLTKELISALPIQMADVNRLLYEEVVALASYDPKKKLDPSQKKHFLSHDSVDEKWPKVITLTDHPSTVGYQLMDLIQSLSKNSHPDHIAKVQVMSVELMIRAHDCFSHAAHMEGINAILQASPDLTKCLLKHKQWSLMGRLLTGIRRYQEMSYLIDILREHYQFEVLLGKNAQQKIQSSELDKTLVHYLHSRYPDDKEMIRMVALHFLMYAELAKMWEQEGEELVAKIVQTYLYVKPTPEREPSRRSAFFSIFASPQQSGPSSPTAESGSSSCSTSRSVEIDYLKSADVNILSEAMQCYSYAAQYYVQEKQLVSALRSSRKAELMALQLSLVKTAGSSGLALRILKLSPEVLSLVMTQHLSVREVILVSRPYNVNPDWASALYFHYIRKGFKKFLDDFLQFNRLSSDLVSSIVQKMEKTGLEPEHKERMSVLLSYIEEVDFVYKIASQLNIRSKMEECLEPPYVCYLKDTVFSQGIGASADF